MILFFISWSLFGVAYWLTIFLEFKEVKTLRPGILELLIMIVVGPVPFLESIFKK